MTRPTAWMLVALFVLGGCSSTRPCCPSSTAEPNRIAAEEPRQIFLDMEIVRIPEGQLEAALGTHAKGLGDGPQVLAADDAAMLLNRWRSAQDLEVLSAPKILALEGQLATMSIGESIRFAHTETETGRTLRIVEPDPEPLWLGEKLRATTTVNEDGETLTVDLYHSSRTQRHGDFTDAMFESMTKRNFEEQHTIQTRLGALIEMPNGGNALIGHADVVEDKHGRHVRAMLIHARILEPEEATATGISGGGLPR